MVYAYAPQVRCDEGYKAAFWEQVDVELSAAPAGERMILGGDLTHWSGE